MNNYLLILFEIDASGTECFKLNNLIIDLKKKNYNFIYGVLSNKSLIVPNSDIIYINDSKYCFLNVIKNCKFNYDYVVHVKRYDLINYDVIANKNYSNNILVSDDLYNFYCKIIPYNLISNLDISYYDMNSKNCEVLKCITSDLKKNFNFISNNNESKVIVKNIQENDLITIIMTCYNSSKTIDNAIRSILNQTYKNFEFLIVDDCSEDNTLEIIEKYKNVDNRIKIIKLSKNVGCYYAKNIALKQINKNTKYIAFQDSDDISYVSRIYKQFIYMKKNKLLMSTVQYYEKNFVKLPMISNMIHIIVFNKIGFFGKNRYGEDENYYYRFLSLFSPDYDWKNNITLLEKNKTGFFGKYKYYHNIDEILYIVTHNKKSLTSTIKEPRILLKKKYNDYYKKLVFNSSINEIETKCHIKFNENYDIFTNKIINNSPNLKNSKSVLKELMTTKTLPSNVKQAYVSKSLQHLENRFLKCFNLKKFITFNEPCIFFGIYNQDDLTKLKRVKKEKYIIWGGTDIDINFNGRIEFINQVKQINNIEKHYSISSNIQMRMQKLNITNERLKFSLLDKNLFKNISFGGEHIFIYNGISEGNEEIYGKSIYSNLIKKLPRFKFIFSNKLNVSYDQMLDIYKKCFIGLRLTINDGNANMVEEMNYINLPIVHNGEYEKSLKWKDENDIIKHINNSIPKILIIFKKDMFQTDGSTRWLFNFIDLIILHNKHSLITVKCLKVNNSINLNNVNFVTNCTFESFNHIYFRMDNEEYDFTNYTNVSLIIHKYYHDLNSYYKKFTHIICNSNLIKDELVFNNTNIKIDVLPPLIEKLQNSNKNNILTFCYCGTIKKSYKTLELLEYFNKLPKHFEFKFYLLYGKHKYEDSVYDNKLINNLKQIEKNDKFVIVKNEKYAKIIEIIKMSHYGFVIHDESIDYKQQSTKLIEYLSCNCIPISYLTYLNCGYLNCEDLHFRTFNELNSIITNIFNKKIKFNDIKINEKINNHLKSNNLKIFDVNNDIIISNDFIENSNKILITNLYKNKFVNKKVILIDEKLDFQFHSQNIYNILNNYTYSVLKKQINVKSNFFINSNESYNFQYDKLIYNHSIDHKYLEIYGPNFKDNIFSFNTVDDYLELNCILQNNLTYSITINSQIFTKGNLFVLSILEIDGTFKDINRNLHIINQKNNKINFFINPKKDTPYIFKIKPSSKNFDLIKFKIIDFKIEKIHSPNNLCDKINIINMDKDLSNYYKIKRTFEMNGILCDRAIGVDGSKDDIQKLYNEYLKIPYNEKEIILKRKLIVSSGALGYLHSMKNIFKKSIINNYNYIMICDDDIKLINNFIYKFDDLLNSINYKFRILMLGSSQWDWDKIDYMKNYYYPNNDSNGSFGNIYHRSTFENIYNKILLFNSPFDDNPMKCNFDNFCYVSYPNLIIAQLEKSNIRTIKKSRSYDKFKWNVNNYFSYTYEFNSKLIYKNENSITNNNKIFLIGIITFNRVNYLKECVNSLLGSLNKNNNYILVFADGNSNDDTVKFIKSIKPEKNVSIHLICNYEHFIYRQSNSIFLYSKKFKYDFGFLVNDDVLFLKQDWDTNYYSIALKTQYHHLVFFDKSHKNIQHEESNKFLFSNCDAYNCQGAFFTFTRELINNVGYFDEDNFKIRGHSHIDFTIRCCKKGYNDINKLYDIIFSEKFIKLNNKNYESSSIKLPLFLRELYKVDLFELNRRINILKDSNRIFVDCNFKIIE